MFLHKENVLKRPSTYYHIVLYKEITLKNNFNAKSDQNIQQDATNCTFFLLFFFTGEHAPSMCAADIIFSI